MLIVLYWLPELNFSGLSLFGVKPVEGMESASLLVFGGLWIAWAYHVFLYYAQRDWKDWRYDLTKENEKFDE